MVRIQSQLDERYTMATQMELDSMIAKSKKALGEKLFILGHHYQREEVMKWADARGDSFKLAKLAKGQPQAEYIVYCGVHFMAEAADVLTSDFQKVILPDLNAGCSMADMAEISEVLLAWEELEKVIDIDRLIPITYMNSAADLKAFVAEKGGAVCTSSNATAILNWALEKGDQIFFFPDQHLGRNTANDMGYGPTDAAIWDPNADGEGDLFLGGLSQKECKEITFFLWRGHCSIHQRFTPKQVAQFREKYPEGMVVVHPECPADTVAVADSVGSTERIIQYVKDAPEGANIGVGTEIHLVERLDRETPGKTIHSLDPLICPCATMSRIDAMHLAWILEGLVEGNVQNQIIVEPETAEWAQVSLDRMLSIT